MLCYLFMRILLVLCMALTSDLSHLIHTSCWKSTWRVLQSLLLKLDSFEVSVTVVFLKMTHSLSSNCPFSFSRHDFASVICCFFSVWSKISQLTHECALTRSVCLFLSGFLSLFADFLHLSAFLPVFFPPLLRPMKWWELGFGCQSGVGGGGSSGARRDFDLGVALGLPYAPHCSCLEMKSLEICFLLTFSHPRCADVQTLQLRN